MRPQLAVPDYMRQVIKVDGINSDIVSTLNNSFNRARQETKDFLVTGSPEQKAERIWNYIKKNVDYKKDAPGTQIIQFPSRMILGTKAGDCKSMALAAAGMMAANGFNNVRLRYTSYDNKDTTPTHVYSVGNMGVQEFIIDAVFNKFNKELPYKSKTDYPMHISVLSGPPMFKKTVNVVSRSAKMLQSPVIKINNETNILKRLLTKVKPGGLFFNVISNKLGRDSGKISFMRYDQDQLNNYKNRLKKVILVQEPTLNKLVRAEIKLIDDRAFTGNIVNERSGDIAGLTSEIGKFSLKKLTKNISIKNISIKNIKKLAKQISPKNILRALKMVGLVVPRKAFLALVALNVRGLAKSLSVFSDSELHKLWVKKFGGELKTLKNTIKSGKNRKPLLGASKKVKAIKGIGYVFDEQQGGIGDGGVSVTALIASATPILVVIAKAIADKTKGTDAAKEILPMLPGLVNAATAGEGQLNEYFQKGAEMAENLGIIPERKLNTDEQAVDIALPGDTDTDMTTEGSGFKINPLYIGGAALAAYLLLKKK